VANELKEMDPKVRDLVFISALLSAAASQVTHVRESRFTNEELLIDLFIPKTCCEEAMSIGQGIISKLFGRLHEVAEEALVVAGMVQSSLDAAVVEIGQIEEERRNLKKTTNIWAKEFSGSEELQEKFGKKGLNAYITFKKKCLKELPFKISERAHKEASGYYQKLQEASSRLNVEAWLYQDKIDRGEIDENKAIQTVQKMPKSRSLISQMPMGVPFDFGGRKAIRTPFGIEILGTGEADTHGIKNTKTKQAVDHLIDQTRAGKRAAPPAQGKGEGKATPPKGPIRLDLSNRSNGKNKRLLLDIIQDGKRDGVHYGKSKAVERLKEWLKKSADMAKDARAKEDFKKVAESLKNDKNNRKVKTTIDCGGIFIGKT